MTDRPPPHAPRRTPLRCVTRIVSRSAWAVDRGAFVATLAQTGSFRHAKGDALPW
jgi:hypothetical protein